MGLVFLFFKEFQDFFYFIGWVVVELILEKGDGFMFVVVVGGGFQLVGVFEIVLDGYFVFLMVGKDLLEEYFCVDWYMIFM